MSSITTSYWTTKLTMMPELEKAGWSCSVGQKVIQTQISPHSILVDGGESASPGWVGRIEVGGMEGSAGRNPGKETSKGAISEHREKQNLYHLLLLLPTHPSTCPNAIFSSPNPATSSSRFASSSRPSLTHPAFPTAPRAQEVCSSPTASPWASSLEECHVPR